MSIRSNDVDLPAIDRKRDRVGLAGLTEAEQTLFLITWTEFEVVLGGLRGFYHNSIGNFAEDAVRAFERVEAFGIAAALRKANAAFPGGAPNPDHALRFEQLEILDGSERTSLDDLTNEYHATNDDLGPLMDRYILAHASDLPFES